MDWKKYLDREFVVAVGLLAVASTALFMKFATFDQWTVATPILAGLYLGHKGFKERKK